MNNNIYDKPFTSVEELQNEFGDAPSLEEMSKFRYIWITDNGQYEADIQCIYHDGKSYYEINESRCSCYGYVWDPIEVVEEYLLKQYPGIELNANIFESSSNIS